MLFDNMRPIDLRTMIRFLRTTVNWITFLFQYLFFALLSFYLTTNISYNERTHTRTS